MEISKRKYAIVRNWYIPLKYDYIEIDDFNVCFSLYMVQDTA